jgi:hypothetical protein
MANIKQEILNRAKDRFINDQVEDSVENTEIFTEHKFIANVLFDYFAKDVAKMDTKKFRTYLADELGYDQELIDMYFEE